MFTSPQEVLDFIKNEDIVFVDIDSLTCPVCSSTSTFRLRLSMTISSSTVSF